MCWWRAPARMSDCEAASAATTAAVPRCTCCCTGRAVARLPCTRLRSLKIPAPCDIRALSTRRAARRALRGQHPPILPPGSGSSITCTTRGQAHHMTLPASWARLRRHTSCPERGLGARVRELLAVGDHRGREVVPEQRGRRMALADVSQEQPGAAAEVENHRARRQGGRDVGVEVRPVRLPEALAMGGDHPLQEFLVRGAGERLMRRHDVRPSAPLASPATRPAT